MLSHHRQVRNEQSFSLERPDHKNNKNENGEKQYFAISSTFSSQLE
jgi:hypothetical protein